MIVWLASYPRSGNTLLRTLINQTMGIKSYSDEFDEKKNNVLSQRALELTGKLLSDEEWESFYERASSSGDLFLIKTHSLPRDEQPAIYIIRDGRKAVVSYSKFHKSFTPRPYPSLWELILGLDYYGSWSEHIIAWVNRPNTLVLRFEELLNPSSDTLGKIAKTIGYSGLVDHWVNPFDSLRSEEPSFFREGNPLWEGDEDWTPFKNAIFFHLHGQIMHRYGYASTEEANLNVSTQNQELMELVEVAVKVRRENEALHKVCRERLDVIDQLKQECDNRLKLIESLSKESKWAQ